ncbi:DUF3883 domain-containing protein [Rhizobium sp. NPDC090279]|uniref:DUF3883 domain-containing protein n=1 Tax=Rhizobium sp. NPDC090279 TaxID=3364499 RepID=UPI00383B978D
MESIGGQGSLSEIYEAVRANRQDTLPKSWEAIVRRELEYNSSDSESYKRRYNLFRSVNGIGSGVWALRANGPDTNRTDREIWSEGEVTALVADYFAMLNAEILGQPYSKTDHRKVLMRTVSRTEGSIERKHQNVSAILQRLGYPWIDGYKPLGNFQDALLREVLRHISDRIVSLDAAIASPEISDTTIQTVFVDRPAGNERSQFSVEIEQLDPRLDLAERDAKNRDLGRAGEEFVISVERARLANEGLGHLVADVSWIARDIGDGLGYDVISFDENGEEIFIEVKTTRGGENTPFFITENERMTAIRKGGRYRLYRVFQFSRRPKIYVIHGPLDDVLHLDATVYRAMIAR